MTGGRAEAAERIVIAPADRRPAILHIINSARLRLSLSLFRCDDQAGGATASCPAGTYRTELNNFEKIDKQPAGLPNGFSDDHP